jgi:hypothetical protein
MSLRSGKREITIIRIEIEVPVVEEAPKGAMMKKPCSISDCVIIELPKIADPRGNLTFVEGSHHIPFEIKRIFYLYDVPGGANRAGHALKTCHQFLIAMAGSFDVLLDDGRNKKKIHLNRSYFGLYIPPLIWREIDNFCYGSVCTVLASTPYSVEEYYRDYETYVKAVQLAT